MLAHPGVFGKALIESPSLLIANRQLLKDTEKANRFPEKTYIAAGTAEEADERRAPGRWMR
jgi:predicted alpha/beta superfamily hydrolase